jgi:hypothetical protein
MYRSTIRSAARLSTVVVALLAACKTGGAGSTNTGSGGLPAELQISSGPAGSGSIAYRVNNDTRGIVSYVKGTPEEIWKTLVVTYNDLNLPITALDSARKSISSSAARAPRSIGGKPLRDYLDCGSGISGPRVDSHDVAYDLVSVVEQAGDSASISTSLVAKATTRGGSSVAPVGCTTTGRLEKRLAQLARLKLAR